MSGQCQQSTQHCSFADASCPTTHQKYGPYAGDLSNFCVSPSPFCFDELRAGENSTCVASGVHVSCWGAAASPTLPTDSGDIEEIELGGASTCARYGDGNVLCWNGSMPGTPELVLPLNSQGHNQDPALAIGKAHACAITSSTAVTCWGNNDFGQLGDGTMTVRTMPGIPVGSLTDVRAVAAGDNTSCAVTGDGGVWCWGDGSHGQLGNGQISTVNFHSAAPVQVMVQQPGQPGLTALSSARSVAVGTQFACAVSMDGSVFCWGLNAHKQLGLGIPDSAAPEQNAAHPTKGLTDVVEVTAGASHACARTNQGTVSCWGLNASHQCAVDSTADIVAPTVVLKDGAPLMLDLIAAGGAHTCGRSPDGVPYCWGANDHQQLGVDAPASSSTPVAVTDRCL